MTTPGGKSDLKLASAYSAHGFVNEASVRMPRQRQTGIPLEREAVG
jgi:hypothetical protein